MRCTNFNLYESIRLKSNNKIPKMKLTLMLFLVCSLDGVYSNKMQTSKSGKALTGKNPEKVGLSKRFLEGLFKLSNLINVDINSPHDNDGDYSRDKFPSNENPLHQKPNYEGQHYPKPNDEKPNYQKPVNDEPYRIKPDNVKQYNSKPNNEKRNYKKFNNEGPFHPKPKNNVPYYPQPDNENLYKTKPYNKGSYYP